MTTFRISGRAVVLTLLLGAPLLPAAPAAAGWTPGLRAGLHGDDSDAFVGFELLTALEGGRWAFNPNVEWVFVDRGDKVTVNGDFVYTVDRREIDVWLGAGPALHFRDTERRGSETDAGLNLLAGLGFGRAGAVRPYLQGKIVLADEIEGVLAFGIRF